MESVTHFILGCHRDWAPHQLPGKTARAVVFLARRLLRFRAVARPLARAHPDSSPDAAHGSNFLYFHVLSYYRPDDLAPNAARENHFWFIARADRQLAPVFRGRLLAVLRTFYFDRTPAA